MSAPWGGLPFSVTVTAEIEDTAIPVEYDYAILDQARKARRGDPWGVYFYIKDKCVGKAAILNIYTEGDKEKKA